MKETKLDRQLRFFARMESLGVNRPQASRLLKAERALQRWGELECGDSNDHASWHVERDEKTGKPFHVVIPHGGDAKARRSPCRDMERAALRWVAEVAEPLGLVWYHQGDPRGCALYVGRKEDLGGLSLEQGHNRLVAVCF